MRLSKSVSVKIFVSSDPDEIEEDINSYLDTLNNANVTTSYQTLLVNSVPEIHYSVILTITEVV